MKKEFKAPVIEERTISMLNSVMDGLGDSAESTKSPKVFNDTATQADYKQWKGGLN